MKSVIKTSGRYSSGIALLSVLLVVVFGSFLMADLFAKQYKSIKQQQFFYTRDSLIAIALGVEEWAIFGLEQAGRAESYTTRNQIWAQYVPPVPFESGEMGGFLIDLNRYLNINNLLETDKTVSKQWLGIWDNFARENNITAEWRDALLDWLDNDDKVRDQGAEEDTYLLKDPPYRPANQALLHIEEVKHIHDFDEIWYETIRKNLTAVPISSKVKALININTAQPEILKALHKDMNDLIVEDILLRRKKSAFSRTKDFRNYLVAKLDLSVQEVANSFSDKIITVKSNFFLLNAQINLGDTRNVFYVVLYRNPKNEVSILHRWIKPLHESFLLPDHFTDESNLDTELLEEFE